MWYFHLLQDVCLRTINIDFIENTLYIVNQRGTDVFLESLDIVPGISNAPGTFIISSFSMSESFNSFLAELQISLVISEL